MDTTQLWNTYHLDVKRFIRSKVKDMHIAEDLTQETFVKVHAYKENVKDESKVKSWILVIARNLVMDYFKSIERNLDYSDHHINILKESAEQTHCKSDCLLGLIKNLPQKYSVPLYLFDIKGVKQAEIAKKLKRPLATVKSQIQRGRKMIIQGYMDCCDYTLNEEGKLVGETKDKEQCKVCSVSK